MSTSNIAPLEFEQSIYQIESKIEELKALSANTGIDLQNQIETLTTQSQEYKHQLYSNLTPAQKIQIARHPKRPSFLDFVNLMCTNFIEMHGDREGSDDRAIIGGVAELQGRPVMIIGTQKGRTTKENIEFNFGMPQPEGYRKAKRLFYHADRFKLPIITLIDTPGAYPGIKAEQNGQGIAIAENLCEMAKLNVPIVAIITGEGCSGGALGLAVADKVFMLEHSYYTVISPEGCASILWRSADMASTAAEALKITAKDLIELNIVDGEIAEPLGGAHYSHEETCENMTKTILSALDELQPKPANVLKDERYNKFRKMGFFLES